MSQDAQAVLISFLIAALSFVAGWEFSVYQISKECDRLGGFWANADTYECKRKTTKEPKP